MASWAAPGLPGWCPSDTRPLMGSRVELWTLWSALPWLLRSRVSSAWISSTMYSSRFFWKPASSELDLPLKLTTTLGLKSMLGIILTGWVMEGGISSSVSCMSLYLGMVSQTLLLENGCVRPDVQTAHRTLRMENEGVFILLGDVYLV